MQNARHFWRCRVTKRVFDCVGAVLLLLLASPVLALVVVIVRIRMGRPVLFRQLRPGFRSEPFELMKFRTMRNDRDSAGRLLGDHERLTALGRFLRASSLDELPELWNVLRGDLSLVGPRPLRMEYLSRYTPEQNRRHEVLPGITGWAQVNGRNALDWQRKFELDVWYVDHWSLRLDLTILVLTIGAVLRRDGITNDGHATMPEFTGGACSSSSES